MGSCVGWGIEVIFRRFFSRANPGRKWINPGFLNGPYLPLYGFGLCFLYLIASLEKYSLIKNAVWNKIFLFIVMALLMTAIEYIAGIIFIKGMKVKLWDYSKQWGNIQGIICPLFSFFWALLGAVYYFFIHPYILSALLWLSNNLAFSFVIGFFYGVLIIDVVSSTQIIVKIRRFAADNNFVVKYDEFRENIRKSNLERKEKAHFLLSMRSSVSLKEHLLQYGDKIKEKISERKEDKIQ